ncbi:hypothetical protein ILUMI_08261 [Ignelater luminosus]|uniref:Uncharacterized protein n=1 Tax=Ignelater luminosus TaxID=2038154 RepID=A0A8K0GG38_IGNLU|nr:hypothetical protein ILUMI_08261 [Ignelater luminosus]
MFLPTLSVGEWMVKEYAKKDSGMNLPEENLQRAGRNGRSTNESRQTLQKEARRAQPYHVKYVNYADFRDFKGFQFYSSIRPGRKPGDLLVSDVCSYKYSPCGEMFYKVNYIDSYESLPKRLTTKHKNFVIPPLYISQPKINKEKY